MLLLLQLLSSPLSNKACLPPPPHPIAAAAAPTPPAASSPLFSSNNNNCYKMCRPTLNNDLVPNDSTTHPLPPAPTPPHTTRQQTSPSSSSASMTVSASISLSSSLLPSKRTLGTIALWLVVTFVVAFGVAYTCWLPFRRTVIFWRNMLPIWLEYKWLNLLHKSNDDYDDRLHAYYTRTADRLVALILKLGGIATKVGQVLGTVGQGLLPAEIVTALQVLHDGVPPRPYQEIAQIIQETAAAAHASHHHNNHTTTTMDDLFVWFDPTPLGAASIAQAHQARLRHNNQTVVVKVQYPEVARQLHADLWNTQLAIRLLSPENAEFAKNVRKRHVQELDFRLEAEHLRRIRYNLQQHNGIEPNLVRIPKVYNETGLCQRNVLIMEYLPGTPLGTLLQQEQDRLARALGKSSSAELQRHLVEQMRNPPDNAEEGGTRVPPAVQLLTTLPWAGRLVRAYAGVKDQWDRLGRAVANVVKPKKHDNSESSSQGHQLMISTKHHDSNHSKHRPHVNLNRILHTLVHVHGLQFLVDGVYNADPHPGNVLLMDDGRLGLLDYGMVGELSRSDRLQAAKAVVALSRRDRQGVAQVYNESGYRAYRFGTPLTDSAILHRFASLHLDRIDLSPVQFAGDNNFTLNGQSSYDLLELLQGVTESNIPQWIEDGRRLGALLMGPYTQTARYLSLSKAWAGLAQRAIQEIEQEEGAEQKAKHSQQLQQQR